MKKFIILLIICLMITGCTDTTSSDNTSNSIEKDLATINAGTSVPDDDPTIEEFSTLLDSIKSKTPNTRQEIADMTVKAYQIAHDEGETASLLELMKALDLSIPKDINKQQNYKDIVATFLVVRKHSSP